MVSVLVLIGVYVYSQKNALDTKETPVVNQVNGEIINSTTFNCAENKSIRALVFKDKVELTLSDKRDLLLLQAVSASGARYVNSDESFVFWNKGNTAYIVEGETTTFKDCIEVSAGTGTN